MARSDLNHSWDEIKGAIQAEIVSCKVLHTPPQGQTLLCIPMLFSWLEQLSQDNGVISSKFRDDKLFELSHVYTSMQDKLN